MKASISNNYLGTNKVDDYCRRNREKSISPSIDSSYNSSNISESEKEEILFYSSKVHDMCSEIFTSFDDLLRNVNHHLMKAIKNLCHTKLDESKWDEIFRIFFSNTMKNFGQNYDEGENFCRKLLTLNHSKTIWEYIKEKNKKQSLKPMIKDESFKSEEMILSPIKNLEYIKNRLGKNIRENLALKIELSLERNISNYNHSFDKVKEKYSFINEQIKTKPDLSYLGRNVDLMASKLKMMKREFNGIV